LPESARRNSQRKISEKTLRKDVFEKQAQILFDGEITSLAVTLPIEIVRELGWREKQKVKVSRVRGGILIKDWKK